MAEQEDPELASPQGHTWAHLSPGTHLSSPPPRDTPTYNHTHNNSLWEQPEDEQDRCSTTKDIKKSPHGDGKKGKRCSLVTAHTPGVVAHRQEGHHNHGCPLRSKGSVPHTGLPNPGDLHREDEPHNVRCWKPVGLTTGRARELWETGTPLVKGSCTDSLSLHLSTDEATWKVPGLYEKEICWLILGPVLEGQGSGKTSFRDRSAGACHFVMLCFYLPGLALAGATSVTCYHLG